MADRIRSSSVALVGGSTTRASSPKVTTAIESPRPRPRTSRRSESLTSSSRSSRAIEPEVSMTNVSAAAGRLRSDESRAWMPTRSRTSRDARNGDRGAVDVDAERGVVRRRIVLVERVDPLLRPDARRVGRVAVGDVALGDRVRGGVDVHRERRDPVLGRVGDRVGARILVGDPAVGARGRGGRRVRGLVMCRGRGLRRGPSVRRCRAPAGSQDEGDRCQGQEWLAHGATSLRGVWGTPGRRGRGRRSGTRRSRNDATRCIGGPRQRRRPGHSGSPAVRPGRRQAARRPARLSFRIARPTRRLARGTARWVRVRAGGGKSMLAIFRSNAVGSSPGWKTWRRPWRST